VEARGRGPRILHSRRTRATDPAMSLKIIAGEYRGRVLRSVKGFMTRPLLGQVREALFNILGDRIADAEVWDLFAGTGASGLEALSRGARRVVFVEKGRQPIETLHANLEMLGASASERAVVVRGDAWEPVPPAPEGEDEAPRPDVIFLDPPYPQVGEDPGRAAWRAQRLAERLAPGGVLCFHFQEGHLEADDFDGDVELRRYGRTVIALLEGAGERPERTPQAACPSAAVEEVGSAEFQAEEPPVEVRLEASDDGDDEDLADLGEEE
jgi:16S rRNA (guanine966-N2)-methyltransferase